jgi:hypothetical protein
MNIEILVCLSARRVGSRAERVRCELHIGPLIHCDPTGSLLAFDEKKMKGYTEKALTKRRSRCCIAANQFRAQLLPTRPRQSKRQVNP